MGNHLGRLFGFRVKSLSVWDHDDRVMSVAACSLSAEPAIPSPQVPPADNFLFMSTVVLQV